MTYTVEGKFFGLLAGAFSAWTLSIFFFLIPILIVEGFSTFAILVFFYIIYGLPFSFIVTFTIGLFFWSIAEKSHQISFPISITFGMLTGTVIGILAFFLSFSIATSFLILPFIGSISGYVSLRAAQAGKFS